MAQVKAFKALDMRPPGQNQGNFEAPDLGTLDPNTLPIASVISGITPVGLNLQEIYGTFNIADILFSNDFSTSTITGAKQFAGSTNATAVEYELSGVNIPGNVAKSALESTDPYSLVIDTLSGADEIIGSVDNDQLLGFEGDDSIYGGMGDDQLTGGGGKDFIRAGVGNDLLQGDGGNDWLKGGKGNDTLLGGAGSDIFVWSGNDDTVEDFSLAEGDLIQIRGDINFSSAASGANVVVTMDPIADFIGGTFTLLNVDVAAFTAAFPYVIA